MWWNSSLLAFFFGALLLNACNEKRQHPMQGMTNAEMKEMLMESSRYHAGREDAEIDAFVEENELELNKTGTGLRYRIYSASETPCDSIRAEQRVWLDYRVSLFDGTEAYSSEEGGARGFVVDHADVESGLHEAVKYMCQGDSGYFILPSHLAHGLTGDQNKIPSNTPIVYEIKVVKVQ